MLKSVSRGVFMGVFREVFRRSVHHHHLVSRGSEVGIVTRASQQG